MKNITSLLLFLFMSHVLQAQWVGPGTAGTGAIYYTNGNVGIGTSSPNNRLVVEGSEGGASSLLIRNKSYNSTNNTGTASLQFAFANHVGPKIEAFKVSTNITGLKLYTEYGYNNPQLAITFKPSAIGTNVGIGTATPTAKLEIKAVGDGVDILKLGTERPWVFQQKGTGSSTHLVFKDMSGGKRFILQSYDGNDSFYFSPSDGISYFSGNMGIGKLSPSAKLHVDGKIIAEEIKVENVTGADFVFAPNYHLMPLTEIEAYIKHNHHLPQVPSAAEMEANGIELGKMNMLLLQKIEELTLHIIELKKENERQNSKIALQDIVMNELKK